MEKKNIILSILIAFFLGITVGARISNYGFQRGITMFSSSTGKVNQVLEIIKKSYVDSISTDILETEAIKGMLKKLDPHSQYIPASHFAAVTEPLEGNFSGIGVQFNMFNDTVVVVNTVAKGPSEKVGIMAGDRIVTVNDTTVAGVKMPSGDIALMLKGTTGSHVKVGIYRRGNKELLDFTITRDRIPLFSIEAAYMIANETGYIKISRFSKTTFKEFSEAVYNLMTEGMEKLIVDLRGNPGGIVDGAVKISEMLLPSEKLIVYTEGAKRERVNYFSEGSHTFYHNMKLALLIDETSASASEILAGAIQDNDRGTIIGRRSFGKGLVQEHHLLSDKSMLRITASRYYTPTGRCIQKPYDSNDKSDYFNELNMRFEHGEMLQVDSIRFNDSLQYVTPAGKTVYGGGGIMPDIFIPADTAGYSHYFAVMRRLVYGFAFEYADENRKELTKIADYKEMEKLLRRKNILGAFVNYTTKHGVAKNDNDLKRSGERLENLVIAHIARNIFEDNGYFSIINKMDKIVQKGVEILNSE